MLKSYRLHEDISATEKDIEINKQAFQRSKFSASNAPSIKNLRSYSALNLSQFYNQNFNASRYNNSFLFTQRSSIPEFASLARIRGNYSNVRNAKNTRIWRKIPRSTNQLPVFSSPFSSFISLSGWNDTEFNTASFNKLSYIHTHLFVSPNSNSTRAQLYTVILWLCRRVLWGWKTLEGGEDGERSEKRKEIYTHTHTHIYIRIYIRSLSEICTCNTS